jgi:hypothetical protein
MARSNDQGVPMNNPDDVRFNNPYSEEESLSKLRRFLKATQQADALILLQKAEEKANRDSEYRTLLGKVLKFGSTLMYRELFSPFGDYWERSRETFPYFPHSDAVNAIDSAMHKIKLGLDMEAAADECNWLHNHNSDRCKALAAQKL